MKKIFLASVALVALSFSVAAQAGLADNSADDLSASTLIVEISPGRVHIYSKVDHITITEVAVNHGNCWMPQGSWSNLPVTLKFGEQALVAYNCGTSKTLEVRVMTDKGAATYEVTGDE
jgi:hypothetical protein